MKHLKGIRCLAMLVAILMIVQILPAVAFADAEAFEDGRFWYHAFAYEQILLVGVGRKTLAETEEDKAHPELDNYVIRNAF